MKIAHRFICGKGRLRKNDCDIANMPFSFVPSGLVMMVINCALPPMNWWANVTSPFGTNLIDKQADYA
jgi:hypothetical protein